MNIEITIVDNEIIIQTNIQTMFVYFDETAINNTGLLCLLLLGMFNKGLNDINLKKEIEKVKYESIR